jgi:hypothetical protein
MVIKKRKRYVQYNAPKKKSKMGPKPTNRVVQQVTKSQLRGFSGTSKGPEYKYFDSGNGWLDTRRLTTPVNTHFVTSGADVGIGFTGFCVNPIAGGSGVNQRIGNKITIKSINVKAHLTGEIANDNVYRLTRIVLIHDKAFQGEFPTTEDIFKTQPTPNVGDICNEPLNMKNSDRFVVLWNKTFVMCSDPLKAMHLNFKKFKKCNIPVQFSTADGLYSSIMSGAILLLAYTDTASVDAAKTFCMFTTRIRYTDQ